MAYLESELTEGAKYRAELLKWKMIAIGAIGSMGLGFQKEGSFSVWAFCMIPLLCVYIDLLYRNSCLRREVLREIIRKSRPSNSADESLRDTVDAEVQVRDCMGGRSLEAGAARDSSIAVGALTMILPFILPSPDRSLKCGLLCSGAVGLLLAIAVELVYRRYREHVRTIEIK